MKASSETQFNIHPMDQFIIEPILSSSDGLQWYSFTNQALWMLVSLVAISLLFIFGIRKNEVVPGRLQSVAEVLYTFVRKMVQDIAGSEGLKFFPYIFTLFIFSNVYIFMF